MGVLLFAALVWYASPGKILAMFKTADYRLILTAWAVRILATVVRTARFSLFVRIRGNVFRAFAVFSFGRLLNMALPFRTGDFAMLAVLKRAQFAPTIAHLLPVWLLLRVTDALALAVWFSAAVALSTFGRQYLPAGITVIVIALCTLFFLHYAIHLVPRRFLENRSNWLVGRLAAIVDGVRASEGTVKRILASLAGLLIWGLLVLSAVLAQLAFFTPLDLQSAVLAAVFVYAFSVIPVNAPLGVGTGEVMWSAAMVLVGVPLETAVPLAIGVRISMLAMLIIEGALGGLLLSWLQRASEPAVGDAKTVSIRQNGVRS